MALKSSALFGGSVDGHRSYDGGCYGANRSGIVCKRQIDHIDLTHQFVSVSDYEDVRELMSDFIERPETISRGFG